jgi:4-hydroxymandelate oxidase
MPAPPSAIRQTLPEGVVGLADHERHAQWVLDDAAWAYFNGGAADEITLRANAQTWQHMALLPRVMRPLAGGHTRVNLLGRE